MMLHKTLELKGHLIRSPCFDIYLIHICRKPADVNLLINILSKLLVIHYYLRLKKINYINQTFPFEI